MRVSKILGIPLAQGLDEIDELPHTISQAVLIRARIDSLNELPKDKRPPRDLWDKPYKLEEFLDEVFKAPSERGNRFVDIDASEAE